MTQVDQVTQRNAAAAEELSSTAEQMAAQAENLQKLMQQLHEHGTGASAPGDAESAANRRAPLHHRHSLSTKSHSTRSGDELANPAASRLKETENRYTGMNSINDYDQLSGHANPTQANVDQDIRPVTDHEFALFQKLIYSKAGIHLAPAKKALLEARLTRRLRESG